MIFHLNMKLILLKLKKVKWIPINEIFTELKNSHQNKYAIFKKTYNVFLSLDT